MKDENSKGRRKPLLRLDPTAFANAAVPQPDPVAVATTKSPRSQRESGPPSKRKVGRPARVALGKPRQASRVGKVQVQVWVSAETRRQLKMLALSSDKTVEELLTGAIETLLRRR